MMQRSFSSFLMTRNNVVHEVAQLAFERSGVFLLEIVLRQAHESVAHVLDHRLKLLVNLIL